MEEFESYFDTLNFHFTSWNDILENENIDIRSNNGCEIAEQNVQLLPRQDVTLYGIIPKMEKRSFSSCKECKHVFNPKDILLHKNCSLRVKSQHVSHFKKKVKAKKKLPLPPLFPTSLEGVSALKGLSTTELRPNSMFIVNANELPPISVDASPMLTKPSPLIADVEDMLLPSTLSPSMSLKEPPIPDKTTVVNSLDKTSSISSSHTNSHSSSRSKKKKYAKSHRDHDSNVPCGIVDDSKGPCTRSIKYSNHSSENEYFHRNKRTLSIDGDYFAQNNCQEIPVSLPVMYLPMSPVSTVGPLKIIQEGDLVCLESAAQVLGTAECQHQDYYTIPEQLNVKVYKTHPRLGSFSLYGARKIGGAIVISKQKLVNQRKDILAAINSKHKPNDILSNYKSVSLLNNSHRLNVLRAKNNKLNMRKTASDKSIGNDVKHIRLSPDVNGFIIHDASEGNEDQQNSNHDGKISVMNIK